MTMELSDLPLGTVWNEYHWRSALTQEAAIATMTAELAQRNWQPIETAPHETPVLVVRLGKVCIAEKRTETPTWEEDFAPYDYWDNPDNDGQDWTDQITHWMPLPAPPKP